jgi:hypothetical protein
VDGVYKTWESTGKFYEFYDPDRIGINQLHRKRGNLYKRITLGDKPRPNFVGWTGLVNSLVIEHLIGLRKDNGRWSLSPNFPAAAAGWRLELFLPRDQMRLKVEVISPAEIHFQVHSATMKMELQLASGDRMEF